MKNGLETFSWDQVAALRISVSFIGTLPFLFLFGRHIKETTRSISA